MISCTSFNQNQLPVLRCYTDLFIREDEEIRKTSNMIRLQEKWFHIRNGIQRKDKMNYVLHPKSEIDDRIQRLQLQMGDMDGAILFHAVNMCYFSGTAQDGLVYIPKEGEPTVMIKRSLERAREESPLEVQKLSKFKNLKSILVFCNINFAN